MATAGGRGSGSIHRPRVRGMLAGGSFPNPSLAPSAAAMPWNLREYRGFGLRCRSTSCRISGAAAQGACEMNGRRRVPNVALLFAALAFLVYCSCSRVIGSKPEKLFDNAFRVGRNLELRLPGVPHARIVPAQRGESISIT